MSSTINNYDDLTAIKGIGVIRQQWFNEILDVYTFEALAALTVDEVETQLKADGRSASRADIGTWIEQANELMVTERLPSQESLIAETAIGAISSSDKVNNWKPFASFVVEFQASDIDGREEYRTTVHHMETDSGMSWPDIKSDELCQWMRTRLGDVSQPGPVEEVITAEPVGASPTKVTITQIRTFQPPHSCIATASTRRFPAMLKSVEPFAVEVELALDGGSESSISVKNAVCSGQLQVHNLVNGKRTYLDMSLSQIQTEPAVCILRLPEISLQGGVYKVGIFAKASLASDYLEVPLVQLI